MACLSSTRAIPGMFGRSNLDPTSLPDSGRARTAAEGWESFAVDVPKSGQGPDHTGRTLASAVGCLRGGLRNGENC